MDEPITNQILGPVTGKVVQIGHADSVTYAGASPARSRYLEWVRQIAPRELVGRDAELAELTRFCTAPDGPDYVWFRAEPWTGKSALMSTFALNPPAGARIVSFFVTARLAGDDTREAFVDAVQEQLAEILETAKDPEARNLPAVFAEAAARCESDGQRLVLVIDGLDEDRSAGGRSIAALLPFPSAGLRVIVASRLNPDVPSDVRADHPLRAPGIERLLAPSEAARAAQGDMERELDALLSGEPDLLGLVTAARGGLSRSDLAELTERPVRSVERALGSVASRSFSRRPAQWHAAKAPEIYVLGHENLHREAEEALGADALADFRSTLDTWAHRYRAAGWPAETPQFLLRGYFRLVQETGDPAALADLAADPARHTRLLDVSGNDLAALAELDVASAAVRNAAEPDLLRLVTLETYRDNFRDRSNVMPLELPALWASLGEIDHAMALARSVLDSDRKRMALTALAAELARTGRPDEARQLAAEQPEAEVRDLLLAEIPLALAEDGRRAEAVASLDPGLSADRRKQVEAHLAVARPDPDFARAIRRVMAMSPGPGQTSAWKRLVRLVAAVHPGLAERFVEASAGHPSLDRVKPAVEIAGVFRRSGEVDRLRAWAERHGLEQPEVTLYADLLAGKELNTAGEDERDAWALIDLLAAAGELPPIPAVLAGISDASWYEAASGRYFAALAEGGEPDRAVELTVGFRPKSRERDSRREIPGFLVRIAESVLRKGDEARARDIAAKAEAHARRPVLARRVADAIVALVEAAAAAGDIRRTEALAPLVPSDRYPGMRTFVHLLAERGEAAIAEKVITGLRDPEQTCGPMLLLAHRLRQTGDTAALARLAAQVRAWLDGYDDGPYLGWRDYLTMMCAVGSREEITDTIALCSRHSRQALDYAIGSVAELAARGEDGPALKLCGFLKGYDRSNALSALVSGLAEAGWADRAEAIAERTSGEYRRQQLLEAFARGVASRDLERALAKAEQVDYPPVRARLLVDLAAHADPGQRKRILAAAAELDHWSTIVPALGAEELAGLLDVADRIGTLYLPEDPDA
ncbi:ATP-binding protein [Amycolatopsis sp. NPDC004079]|uniref:ATP-binding protein n=1 Tax=Amycolatopsis sp. NPDC004079 TaxID=3154549 RepID=UPI0033BB3A79